MNGWKNYPISSLVIGNHKAKSLFDGARVWNLNLDQIEPHSGRVIEKVYANTNELGPSTYSFEPRTVLYSKLRPYLNKVVVADEIGVATTELVPIRCNPDAILPEFLAYFLRSPNFLTFATTVVAGAKMPRMVMSEFWNFKIPLPSLPEQRRIAAILDQADALRAKRREALAQLDSLTQSIFIAMFGDPSIFSKIWECHPLGELTEKITDGEHLNPEFSLTGMPIVMAGNVLEDSIDLSATKNVELALGEKFRRKCNPERGDLLVVSRGATIGRMCAVDTDDVFCLMGSVILIKVKREKLSTAFVSALLKHPMMRSALYKASGSSAQQAIYLKDLKNLPFIQPPMEIQQRFSERVAAIDELRAPHRQSLTELDALFASLQHRAFRGEL